MKLLIIALLLLPAVVFAAPSKPSVSGSGPLTISGSSFGASGPSVLIFDDFERGANGDNISTTATIGTWSGYGSNTPKITTAEAHSGSRSGALISSNSDNQLNKNFTNATELLITFWAKVPAGSCFPGASTPGTLTTISSWKMSWFMDGPTGYLGNDDMCMPTVVSNNTMMAGNSYTPSPYISLQSDNWNFSGWNRFTVWAKAGSPTSSAGNWYYEWLGVTTQSRTSTQPVFAADGAVWNYVNIPGWHSGAVSNTDVMYDDIYISTGANAAARVELCDTNTWAARTHCEIQPPTAWSDTGITATYNPGSFINGQTAYFYVIDSTGAVSPASDPYTIGGAVADTTKPTITPTKNPGRYTAKQAVTFNSTDDVGVSTTRYRASFDGGTTWTGWTSSNSKNVLVNRADEITQVEVCDAAANCTTTDYRYRKQRRK